MWKKPEREWSGPSSEMGEVTLELEWMENAELALLDRKKRETLEEEPPILEAVSSLGEGSGVRSMDTKSSVDDIARMPPVGLEGLDGKGV